MVVADSNVLIDYLRGRVDAVDAVDRSVSSDVALTASTLTKVELLAGMRPDEEAATRDLFAVVDWIPVTDDIAELAGAMARRFHRSHPGVEVVDYVIAATAEDHDAMVWTLNLKHFPMFPDLEAPY